VACAGRDRFGAGNRLTPRAIGDGTVFVGTTAGVALFGER
jgi:hypothetical protein